MIIDHVTITVKRFSDPPSSLFLLVLPLMVDAQLTSSSDMYGSLQSPNFPEPYPRETQLHWNISVPDGFQIKLYFSHFDLEPSYLCEYDYVKVRPLGIMGSLTFMSAPTCNMH